MKVDIGWVIAALVVGELVGFFLAAAFFIRRSRDAYSEGRLDAMTEGKSA